MENLISKLNGTRRLLDKKTDEFIKNSRKSKRTRRFWKGKKIISIEEWNKKKNNISKTEYLLNCLPEDYVEMPFNRIIDYGHYEVKIEEWRKDYHEYMEELKSPGYGERWCRSCILHPYPHPAMPKSIREIILKAFDDKEYPCSVVNKFKCPYGQFQENSKNELINAENVCHNLSLALMNAEDQTKRFDAQYRRIDFEGEAKKILGIDNEIENQPYYTDEIKHLKSLKLPLRTIKDLYQILINRKKLSWVFDQHISTIEKEKKKRGIPFSKTNAKKIKNFALSFISKIKHKIRLEDLKDLHNRNLKEEREEQLRHEDARKFIIKMEPERYQKNKLNFGEYIDCRKFGNIFCKNCEKWLCYNHWEKHLNLHKDWVQN